MRVSFFISLDTNNFFTFSIFHRVKLGEEVFLIFFWKVWRVVMERSLGGTEQGEEKRRKTEEREKREGERGRGEKKKLEIPDHCGCFCIPS